MHHSWILVFVSVLRQVFEGVAIDLCCENSYLRTHEGLCGPNNVTSDIDSLIENLYLAIKAADEDLGNSRYYPPDYQPKEDEEFDFIVVGAGAAGCVVANRLSEVTGWKVLLIEAGGDPPRNSEVPALASTTEQTEVDWQYKTEPSSKCCQSMKNHSCNWPRGKVLGGSTTINGLLYMRGNARDYDDWRQPGWSYKEVLPYFKKSEDLKDPSLLADPEERKYHGIGGPVKVTPWLNLFNPVMQTFIDAVEQEGFNYNKDCNGKSQLGICPTAGFLEDYRRCSAAKAYLSTIRSRINFKLARYSLVSKVLIENDTAYGVELISNQGPHSNTVRVRAKKETIVCGGIVNTPQILMLSGVGPREHLSAMGLPVKVDLPVGENLHDHPFILVFMTLAKYDPPRDSPVVSTFDFLFQCPSTLSNLVGEEFSAFLDILDNDGYPDLQFIAKPRIDQNDSASVKAFVKGYAFTKEVEDQLIKINQEGYTLVVLASALRPCSRGRILLKSTDPKEYPRILPGYLNSNNDVERLAKIYEFFLRLAQTPAMRKMEAKVHEIKLSDCENLPRDSFAYRECYLRHLVVPGYHQAGSCPMGAVLDAQLRVRGVRRLRVADASVMPFVVSGNTNAPTNMIGEKAADMIKKSWLPRRTVPRFIY